MPTSNAYTVINDPISGEPSVIVRGSDGAFIPIDPLNADYQAYLLWQSASSQ